MGGARRSARAALPSVSSDLVWHPAFVPRGPWDAPPPARALSNLRAEAELVRALAGALAGLSAAEALGRCTVGRWTLGDDGLPYRDGAAAPEPGDGGSPGDLVGRFLVLLGARPSKGSDRPVLPRRHPHGAALGAWCARWRDAGAGAREALVDLLEVASAEGAPPALPAPWGIAAPWSPAASLAEPGLRRIAVTGPAALGALAAWCGRAGVRRVALDDAAPYPFASLEALVKTALGSGAPEARRWLSERLGDRTRLARDLAALLSEAGPGFCLWPGEALDPCAAEVLERAAPRLRGPLLLAGASGDPAGRFGPPSAVALPRAAEEWFRLHALEASGSWDGAVESAVARDGGLLAAGASLLPSPLPPAGPPPSEAPPAGGRFLRTGPGAALAALRQAEALQAGGQDAQAALERAWGHTLAGQTELAWACLSGAEGPEADWLRARAWERRQDFAGTAAALSRAALDGLPPPLAAEARVLWGQASWLTGRREEGLRLLAAVREEGATPDAAALASLALATCRLQAGEVAAAERDLGEAEAQLPRCRRALPAIVWHQRRGLLLRKRGAYGAAAEAFSEAARLAAREWDHWMESASLLEAGNALRLLCRFEEARGILARAEEGFCALGLERVRRLARFDRMLCDAESGHLLAAQEILLAGVANPGRGEGRAVDRYWLARVLQLRGEPTPALEQIALALEELRDHPDAEVEAPLRILKLRLLLDAHQGAKLRAAAEAVRPLVGSAPDPDDRLDAASVLLEARARLEGRREPLPEVPPAPGTEGASPGARARWALAQVRAGAGGAPDLLARALVLGREIADPALESEVLWEFASRGALPSLGAADSERVARFLGENRVKGPLRGLLPLLSAAAAPPPRASREAPPSPLLLLEEARRGRVDLEACARVSAASGALLRAPGEEPRWAGEAPPPLRRALAGLAGQEGLLPVAGGWVLGALGRGGTWAGFAWEGAEPPSGEAAALARVWTAVLPVPGVPGPAEPPEGPEEPLLEKLLLGSAPALLALRRRLAASAPFSFPVLLTGEPGVGKEVCARALHLLSPRGAKPWVPANCAHLTPTLAASLLFGHRRGAYTGADRDGVGLVEAARGGTLFLDEVGELPPETQAQLLRFLQDGSYAPLGEPRARHSDARVVAATNRDLERAVAEGAFRADLFHRLDVIRIDVPPLRDRPGDVRPLFDRFLAEAAGAEGRPVPTVAEGVWGRLAGWRWPGNVRELQNLARSLLVAGSGRGQIQEEDLPEPLRRPPSHALLPGDGLRGCLRRTERAAVEEALRRSGGNVASAARELGITRQALARKLSRGEVPRGGSRGGGSTLPPLDRSPSRGGESDRGRA